MTDRCAFAKKDGCSIDSYRITNSKGEYVEILNYGAVVRKLCVQDAHGQLVDVALGYDSAEEYDNRGTYFGAVIGRAANRISGSSFSFEGKTYRLFDTGGGVSLHGGKVGFNNRLFKLIDISPDSITLALTSDDGDEGYPGCVELEVSYTFTDDSDLIINYRAFSDSRTLFNPTNHTYFNLFGHDSGISALDTFLCIRASYITPLGRDFTPDGTFLNVRNTPFDFKSPKKIGRGIEESDGQLSLAGGYDVSYVSDPFAAEKLPEWALKEQNNGIISNLPVIACAFADKTGIALLVRTNLPCVQFYSGNFIDRTVGKGGAVYDRRFGFCLETQGYPDAVNKKTFPSITLFPGERYESTTVYSFSTVPYNKKTKDIL